MAKQPNARHSAIEQPTEPASALPSTEKGRDTRRRLMKAAAQLYENGYANARITDITDAAGLSAGAFYRYFEDRQQLTRELLREMMDEMYVFIRSPFDETQPIRSVLESTRKYFEFYEAHRALLGVVVELSQTDAEVAHLWDAAKRAFNDRIVRSLERLATGDQTPLRGLDRHFLSPDLSGAKAAAPELPLLWHGGRVHGGGLSALQALPSGRGGRRIRPHGSSPAQGAGRRAASPLVRAGPGADGP